MSKMKPVRPNTRSKTKTNTSAKTSSSERNSKILIKLVKGLILVVITIFGTTYVNKCSNRPKISSTLDCVNIFSNEENDFVLNLYLKFENSGESNTSFSYDVLKLKLFNDVDPYSFKLEQTRKIQGRSFIKDTLKVILPRHFNTNKGTPKLYSLSLSYHQVQSKENITIDKDTSDVIWEFTSGIVVPENPSNYSLTPDLVVKNGIAKMAGKQIPIEYKGKIYNCFIFPKETNVSYKIEQDNIRLKYDFPIDAQSTKGNTYDFLIKPIIFKPATEIEDKFILPNNFQVSMRTETTDNHEIKIKNYDIDIYNSTPDRTQIIFLLK
jgi:hypothetical protein